MYMLSNGHSYIGINGENVATSVSNVNKALQFTEEKKALNYMNNLKNTLKKFNWQVIKLEPENESCENAESDEDSEIYSETELEKSGFDIFAFFKDTITTISQLRDYAKNMKILEQEYNKKILDVRHYIRDESIKLNAIQMQKVGYFLQKLERERYECKGNRMIAQIFLSDLNNLGNIDYVEEIRNIKESIYNPKILTFEMLDEISGKRGKNDTQTVH